MFVAVFAAALCSGISTADSCTVFLRPLVGGGDECSASNELMNRINQNISTLLPRVVHCVQLGRTPEYPANSCAELAEREPDIPSGNYWILNSTQSPVQVFCEMGDVFPASLNVTGGWVRVANLNMTDPNQQCPENLRLSYTSPIRLCGRTTDRSCDSVIFTTYGVQYRQVCGRVRGYQFASPDGFRQINCPTPCNIDNPYVDGVSITHGASPRKHIWTYGANCPCTGGTPPPAFVGSVSQDSTFIHGITFSTLMTHCGMDKIVIDLSVHAVIPQTSRGSARTFLSQLLTTWRFVSVQIKLNRMRMSPLILFNSTYSESS